MESLPEGQPRYWTPDPELVARASSMAKGLVVDLGPGAFALPVDGAVRIGWGWDNTDITTDRLPFADGEVDFLYCRHTLEDLLDPAHTLREISRVAKSGWIEVPSLASEIVRRVDGGSPAWRGYVHHRSVFWSVNQTLMTAPKYAALEYENFSDLPLAKHLKNRRAWNHVHTFSGGLRWRQLRHEVDFWIGSRDYPGIIRDVLQQAINEEAPTDPATAEG